MSSAWASAARQWRDGSSSTGLQSWQKPRWCGTDGCALLHLNPTQTMRRTYDLWFKRLPEAWWPYVPQPLKESNFSEVIFFVFTIGCAGGGMAKLFSTPTPKIIRDDDTRR